MESSQCQTLPDVHLRIVSDTVEPATRMNFTSRRRPRIGLFSRSLYCTYFTYFLQAVPILASNHTMYSTLHNPHPVTSRIRRSPHVPIRWFRSWTASMPTHICFPDISILSFSCRYSSRVPFPSSRNRPRSQRVPVNPIQLQHATPDPRPAHRPPPDARPARDEAPADRAAAGEAGQAASAQGGRGECVSVLRGDGDGCSVSSSPPPPPLIFLEICFENFLGLRR